MVKVAGPVCIHTYTHGRHRRCLVKVWWNVNTGFLFEENEIEFKNGEYFKETFKTPKDRKTKNTRRNHRYSFFETANIF